MFFGSLGCLHRWAPAYVLRVNSQKWFSVLSRLHVLLHQFRSDTDNMLALPILDHVEGL